MKEIILKSGKFIGIGIVILIAVIVLLNTPILKGISFYKKFMGKNNVSTISESSLQKVLETSQLSTLEYTYNAVAEVKKNYLDTVKYYVAYEGIVKAGIDFEAIDIDINEDGNVIKIILPDIQIHSTFVDAGKMEYIFIDDEYETETVVSEAYQACVDDLKKKSSEEIQLFDMAKENAKGTVKALIEPWVKQVNEKFTIEIV